MLNLFSIFLLFTMNEAFALDKEESFSRPVREHAIIATKKGYFPDQISIFEGELLRIFFTSTTKMKSCLKIQKKNFFLSAKLGKIEHGEIHFDRPGIYDFYCSIGKLRGRITVLSKVAHKGVFHKKGRTIQGREQEKKKWEWRPKDE